MEEKVVNAISFYPKKVVISGDAVAREIDPNNQQNGVVYVRSDVASNSRFWGDVAGVYTLWYNDSITHKEAMERIAVLFEI